MKANAATRHTLPAYAPVHVIEVALRAGEIAPVLDEVSNVRVFVPIEDDLIPEGAVGMLVPYRCGLDCWHALGEGGSVLRVDVTDEDIQRCKIISSPDVSPSLAA